MIILWLVDGGIGGEEEAAQLQIKA